MTATGEQVRTATAELVDAFGSGDLDRYFACFAEDATFLFHTTGRRLTSTQDYRRQWEQWVREDDLRVLGCTTRGTAVQDLGEVAVVTHDVRTLVATRAGQQILHERETIVFARGADGSWLAVHEHLSPAPDDLGGES